LIRRWCLLSLVLLLQACSAVKLGYHQLPTIGYWWLDAHLSFTDSQTGEVRQALSQLHSWHRQQELPVYASWLGALAAQSSNTLTEQETCKVWDDAQRLLDRTVRESIRQAAPLALQLGPQQLQHLARHWERKNEEWEDEWLRGSPKARLERRFERAVDRYADFYGPLTRAQETLVRQQLQQSVWTPEWGRRDRQRRQQDLLSTLQRFQQGERSPAQAEAALLGVWQRWVQPPQLQDQQVMTDLTRQACRQLAELHNTTSPEQRQRAARRLRAYERDLRELAP